MTNGTLFTEDFLGRGLADSPAWASPAETDIAALEEHLHSIFQKVADPTALNEPQTEERIIRPILAALGWNGLFSVQENIEIKGRANVPDYAFFAEPSAFALADRTKKPDEKLRNAIAVGDAKAWSVSLDAQGSGARPGETAAAQILRYLLRAEIVSDRRARWAILTSGQIWRLYYGGAKSLLEGYFEIDLADVLALPGAQTCLILHRIDGETDAARRARLLKTFGLVFRPQAFRADPALDGRTFHEFALAEGAKWEERVRTDLSRVVFEEVFPGLIRALAKADLQRPKPYTTAYLAELRDAALMALYRLLFALYAEDRDLLPSHDRKYQTYSLSKLRDEIAERRDEGEEFSARRKTLWLRCAELFGVIDEGDDAIGVPPYNGGLFAKDAAAILDRAPPSDRDFAPLLDKLSRTLKGERLVRINFRDLSVRELGAIYERLLEHQPVADDEAPNGVAIRPNPFSRKNSGSYYTPDELVSLIIERTVGPLIDERIAAFEAEALRLASDKRPLAKRLEELARLDPASRILDLKVCDPAMGSGHFLVSLIDYLAGRVFTAMSAAAAETTLWAKDGYASPLIERLREIRERIAAEAAENGWTIRPGQLADQNLVKRMVLKRCVYGVDKNPMAVELAKVALWLHTFTAGAPLSFLDHHLRCGDSLFGEKVRRALDELSRRGSFLISDAVRRAEASIGGMEFVESLTDAEIAEVRQSNDAFAEVERSTRPLKRFLDFWQVAKWLDLSEDEKRAMQALLDGKFGDPLEVAGGSRPPLAPVEAAGVTEQLFDGAAPTQMTLEGTGVASLRDYQALKGLIARAHGLAEEEHLLHWEVAFPGVWRDWQSGEPKGGFDCVIGNPPWDRMKMQEVEWFAARAPTIAKQARAADRKAAIEKLREANDPLAAEYDRAGARAEKAMERARKSGDFPLLSKGDINIYSLFVERAQGLLKADGVAGLLTPSGIASDLTASAFFKSVASTGRVACIFDFENRRGADGAGVRRPEFFPDVDSRFKFCVFVVGARNRTYSATDCGFFLQDPPPLVDPERLFVMSAEDFALVNPNTGTAPIFRTKRDAELTIAIYQRLPVLVDRSNGKERKAWPVRYLTMFHMTNDSALFWTRERLEKEGAYAAPLGRWKKGKKEWLPLYEGKMVQAFDHRAANVVVNEENLHRPAQPEPVAEAEHADAAFVVSPHYCVAAKEIESFGVRDWMLGFKEITAPSNERTMIAAFIPEAGVGNTLPLILPETPKSPEALAWLACLNGFAFDYVARQKVQGQHLNWFIMEQLPVVPASAYLQTFGDTDAAAIVKDHVLRLTYTAWDMQPFACDMGYDGPPFKWNQEERRHLRARLDALYFHLYGITDEADIRYILSTFPIVERKDRAAHEGVYLSAELIVWYFRALAAGDAQSQAPTATLIRNAKRAVS